MRGLSLRDGDASLTLTPERVEAATAWCQAAIPLALTPDELPRLADGLRRLTDDGHGSFLWMDDGGRLRIEVVMAKRGETHWSVRLQAPPDFLHELRLVFVGRQDDLPHQVEGLLPLGEGRVGVTSRSADPESKRPRAMRSTKTIGSDLWGEP